MGRMLPEVFRAWPRDSGWRFFRTLKDRSHLTCSHNLDRDKPAQCPEAGPFTYRTYFEHPP